MIHKTTFEDARWYRDETGQDCVLTDGFGVFARRHVFTVEDDVIQSTKYGVQRTTPGVVKSVVEDRQKRPDTFQTQTVDLVFYESRDCLYLPTTLDATQYFGIDERVVVYDTSRNILYRGEYESQPPTQDTDRRDLLLIGLNEDTVRRMDAGEFKQSDFTTLMEVE